MRRRTKLMLCESTLRSKLSGSRQSSFLAAKKPRVFGMQREDRERRLPRIGSSE